MRLWLSAAVVALLALPATAAAQAQAPDGPAPASPPSGGAAFGAPVPHPRSARRLRATTFAIAPGRLVAGQRAVVRLRVRGGARAARLRVELVPAAGGRATAVLRLGWRRRGRLFVRRWALAVAPGDYVARLHAVDRAGATLRRSAAAPGKVAVTVTAPVAPAPAVPLSTGAVFPLRGGDWSFGGPENRFGATRNGHVHQGQDVLAPCGTPIQAPVAGTISWRAVQDGGAGHYLVEAGGDGRDYVFMHLVAGSELVAKGDAVGAGRQLGQVGDTGDAVGCHLHFEIWPDGWYARGSSPIDPLPQLEAWSGRAAGA